VLFDTHAHLDFDDYDTDRDSVITRAEEAGVAGIINPGIDIETSRKAIALSERYDCVYPAVGIHPNYVGQASPGDNLELSLLAEHPRVVAIGEIGLDFYRDRTPHDLQARAFAGQLELARMLDLPVIIHFRDVEMDGIAMIGEDALKDVRGVFHCFGGSPEFAVFLVSQGFYIGFDGPLTYRRSDRVEVAEAVPLDRCLIETDAPFLAPQQHRGKRNEPAYVRYVAEKLAEIKSVDLDEVIKVTGKNARDLFGFVSRDDIHKREKNQKY